MSASETLLTPGVLAIVPEAEVQRSIRFDLLAVLTCCLIVVMYSVLAQDMRTASQLGSAIKIDSLRKVLTAVFAFLAIATYLGEPETVRTGLQHSLRLGAGLVVAVFAFYVTSFTWLSLEILTDGPLPGIAAILALIAVVVLWQPWRRLTVYRKA